jgi:hypothetical protein
MKMTLRFMSISSLLLALGGCAAGPVSIREQGTFFVYAAEQDPLKTARCIIRNTERHSPGLIATERRTTDANGWEVIVGDGTDRLATVRMDIAVILVRIQPSSGLDNQKFANDLVYGC